MLDKEVLMNEVDRGKLDSAALDLLNAADFTLNVLLDNCISDGREESRELKIRAQMMLRQALRKAGVAADMRNVDTTIHDFPAADKYQKISVEMITDAMLCLRMLTPGCYNRVSRFAIQTDDLLYLNSVIGDGFHNVAEILVEPMSESGRGERLRREVARFKQSVELVSTPDTMPDCWVRLMRNANYLLAS